MAEDFAGANTAVGYLNAKPGTVRRQNIWLNSRRRLAEVRPRLGVMLGGELAVLQAPMFDGLSLDPFSLFDDVAGPAEVGVGGRHVLQALVVTL